MSLIQLDRKDTSFIDPFLDQYLYGTDLNAYKDYTPELQSIPAVAESRKKFDTEKRRLLHSVLLEQYKRTGIVVEAKLKENIDLLLQENTYTVTTGQQIHVGLGPLYVLYKVLNTIMLAEEVNRCYSEIKLVPVFWMATEDHDLEEIKHVHLFGKKMEWETDQKGPVGRMSTKGLIALFQQIRQEFRLTKAQEEFVQIAETAYKLENLADATRYFLHQLFGSEGLLVLDADNERLKSSFVDVMNKEIHARHIEALRSNAAALQDAGYDNQIYIRDINLFYMGSGDRLKLNLREGALYAEDDYLCELSETEAFLKSNAIDISPNVALRPLYQESILPNLIYVGGPSEIKYWLQLHSLFQINNYSLPLLFLRSSWVILEEKRFNQLSNIQILDFYCSDSELIQKHLGHIEEQKRDILSNLIRTKESLELLNRKAESTFNGFSLRGKVDKILPKLQEIENLLNQQFLNLAQNDPEFNRFIKVKSAYFSTSKPQERERHIIEFPHLSFELLNNRHHSNFTNLLKINHLVTKSV